MHDESQIRALAKECASALTSTNPKSPLLGLIAGALAEAIPDSQQLAVQIARAPQDDRRTCHPLFVAITGCGSGGPYARGDKFR